MNSSAFRALSRLAVAVTMGSNAQAKSKEVIMLLTNFIFMSLLSFYFFLLFWPSVTPRREESFSAVAGVLQEFRREVTRKL